MHRCRIKGLEPGKEAGACQSFNVSQVAGEHPGAKEGRTLDLWRGDQQPGPPQAEERSLKSGLLELRGGSPGFRSRSWRLVTSFPLSIFLPLALDCCYLISVVGHASESLGGLLKIRLLPPSNLRSCFTTYLGEGEVMPNHPQAMLVQRPRLKATILTDVHNSHMREGGRNRSSEGRGNVPEALQLETNRGRTVTQAC